MCSGMEKVSGYTNTFGKETPYTTKWSLRSRKKRVEKATTQVADAEVAKMPPLNLLAVDVEDCSFGLTGLLKTEGGAVFLWRSNRGDEKNGKSNKRFAKLRAAGHESGTKTSCHLQIGL